MAAFGVAALTPDWHPCCGAATAVMIPQIRSITMHWTRDEQAGWRVRSRNRVDRLRQFRIGRELVEGRGAMDAEGADQIARHWTCSYADSCHIGMDHWNEHSGAWSNEPLSS